MDCSFIRRWRVCCLALLLVVCSWPAAARADAGDELKYQLQVGDELGYTFTVVIETSSGRAEFAGSNRIRVDPVPRPATPSEEKPSIATGTGFFVTADGYLLTCAHVVKDAAKIEIAVNDKKYEGRVIAQDKPHDLALVKIDVTGVPPLPLADSDAVELGQEVRAVGFPLSSVLGDSMKIVRGTLAGIINEPDGKKLQVDAGINPGNSGGPAINEQGQVVGVVSAKLTGETVSNVGFVQPINDAKVLLKQNKVSFKSGSGGEKLEGPALFKRVSPSVVLITVTLRSDLEKVRVISYRGSYGRQVPPGQVNVVDEGHAVITTAGEPLWDDCLQSVPGGVGFLGMVGLETYSEEGRKKWRTERVARLALNPADRSPGGLFNAAPPTAARPPSAGRSPFHGLIVNPRPTPQADTPNTTPRSHGSSRSRVELLPIRPNVPAARPRSTTVAVAALEHGYYEIKSATDSLVTIGKTFEMVSLARPGDSTRISIVGEGTLTVDARSGRPENYTFQGTLKLASDEMKIKYDYRRVDPASIGGPLPPPTPAVAGGPVTPVSPANPASPTSPASAVPPGGPPVGSSADAGSGPAGLGADARPSAVQPPRVERAAAPTGAKLAKAERLVAGLYEKELASADTDKERLALAKTMLDQAHQQKAGGADQYVLLDKARDLAARSGDIRFTNQVTAEISRRFRADMADIKASSLELLSVSAGKPTDQKAIAETALSAIDDAVRTDNFELARKLGKLALTSARKSKDDKLAERINQRAAEFKAAQAAYAEFQQAEEQLKKNAKDGFANTIVGKYLCFVHDDWKEGLPHLAQADDTTLRNLAEAEVAQPTVAEVQVDIADTWWDLGNQEDALRRTNLRAHARAWYARSVSGLSGLAKMQAERRLADEPEPVAEASPVVLPTTDESGKPLPPAIAARNHLLKQVETSIGAGRIERTRFVGVGFSDKQPFAHVPEETAIVVGFDVSYNGVNLAAIRPIYLTAKGQKDGPPFGKAAMARKGTAAAASIVNRRILAKKGYAVSGLRARGNISVTGFCVCFMEIGPTGLKPETMYESPWIGPEGVLEPPAELTGNGKPVVGIFGHGIHTTILGLGLILADK